MSGQQPIKLDLNLLTLRIYVVINALTEFIAYFKRRTTSLYLVFLDASKAFEKLIAGYYLII